MCLARVNRKIVYTREQLIEISNQVCSGKKLCVSSDLHSQINRFQLSTVSPTKRGIRSGSGKPQQNLRTPRRETCNSRCGIPNQPPKGVKSGQTNVKTIKISNKIGKKKQKGLLLRSTVILLYSMHNLL